MKLPEYLYLTAELSDRAAKACEERDEGGRLYASALQETGRAAGELLHHSDHLRAMRGKHRRRGNRIRHAVHQLLKTMTQEED